MAPPRYQALTGTHDVLPPASARWEKLLVTYAGVVERAGYGLVQSPMFEDLGVFQRESEGADAVRKEMYDFRDKGGNHVALRPEGTASIVRAFVEHHPLTPWKVWYATPAFRYERAQAGRLRQHHQVGLELLGTPDPEADVEVITLAAEFLRALGLEQVDLHLNTMGTSEDRARYLRVLQAWLRRRVGDLDPEDQERVEVHPMRVLDSKRRATRQVTAEAPSIADHLSPASEAHFVRVEEGLRAVGILPTLAPRLVRGFDYYTHTTFEFVPTLVANAQSTILGGGRYDGLVEELGGPPTPGIGFGAGIERLLIACDAEGVFAPPTNLVDVFVVDITGGAEAREITRELRAAGVRCDRAFDQRAMRAQMKAADRSGAAWAVIIGEDEQTAGEATVRPLAEFGAEQVRIARSDLSAHVAALVARPATPNEENP